MSSKLLHVPRLTCCTETRGLIQNPINVLLKHTRDLGGSYIYHLGGVRKVLVSSDRAVVRRVLKTNATSYHKSTIQTRYMVEYLGPGLLSDEWSTWKPKRRSLQQGLQRGDMDRQSQLMHATLAALQPEFHEQTERGALDLCPILKTFVFAMTCRSLLGVSLKLDDISQISSTITDVQSFMLRRVFQPYLYPWFAVSGQLAYHQRLRGAGDDIVLNHIRTRLDRTHDANESEGHNLLDVLNAMQDPETGQGLTEQQILAESIQFLVAGHETSSNALSWAFCLLGRHPHYIDQLRKEFNSALGERPPLFSDLSSLPLSNAVLDEAMRMYPPFWILDRVALAPDTLEGHQIEAGDMVMCFLYALQRDPELWPQPDQFIPERFFELDNTVRESAWLAFGNGPRRCIGAQLARIQMIIVLHFLITGFDIEYASSVSMELQSRFILSPKQGLPVRIKPRILV